VSGSGEQVMERVGRAPAVERAGAPRGAWLRALLPLDNGPAEIRALDGLRAIAALMIVLFHILLWEHVEYQPWSQATNSFWYVLATGVQLFFTLSGFLLFRPYVAAMLAGKPLPSAVRFYQKRALRILPAYWVALAVLLASNWQVASQPQWLNALTHATLLHDIFPAYDRDLDGPFWTLAVEAQFYLALPWLAAATAWVAGYRHAATPPTPRRVIGALLAMIGAALAVRWVGIAIMGALPAANASSAQPLQFWLGLLLLGMQGKYLEVFLVGAIAATLYTVATGLDAERRAKLRPVAIGLALFGLAVMVPCAAYWQTGSVSYTPGARWGWDVFLYPLATGVGYSAILLGAVWGGPWLRAPFEFAPLRFTGHISYSIYIWHLPILHANLPYFQYIPFPARVVLVFVLSYLSYQLVERPFLQRRRRIGAGAS
jgi:peptidoglycan/LPS O-acetylase OafA/YrhL